jgi:hypothetical protein
MEKSNVETYLNRYEFTQAFKEKVVLEVYFQGKDIQKAVEEHDLPSIIRFRCGFGSFRSN